VKSISDEDLDERCGSPYAKDPYLNRKEMTSRTHMQFGKKSGSREKRLEASRG
jgi:hypothetical protein